MNLEEETEYYLCKAIELAKKIWPETEYKYTKVQHTYHSGLRGKKGYHTTCLTRPDPEITREEYEANYEKGKRDSYSAFMGKSRQTYYTYEKKIRQKGWYEELRNMLKNVAGRADGAV